MNEIRHTVLLLGSGGREHAIAWKIARSKRLEKLFIAPGNTGTASVGTNVAIPAADFPQIRQFVVDNKVTLVVVGPEDPLVNGIRNFFKADEHLKNIPVIGPSKEGAMLEGSKEFAKDFMMRHSIPTAVHHIFSSETLEDGFRFLENIPPPYVLKADGLAAGKGVVIHNHLEHAKRELFQILRENKFGDAGKKVVVEQFLKGIELSVFVVTDGKSYRILPNAKDYKRVGEGDTGPNTGGMGAVSPVPFADHTFMRKVEDTVIRPTIKGIVQEGLDYCGFLFFGLMNVDGNPYVVEYNCRLGDPETEVIIPRIKNDLLDIFDAITAQDIHNIRMEFDSRAAATIMLVSKGYPDDYEKNKPITGIEENTDTIIFHAGTKKTDGRIITSGGRVLAVTSLHETLQGALANSFEAIRKIHFDGMYFRSDIGYDVLKTTQEKVSV